MVGRMRSERVGERIAKLVEEAMVDCYTRPTAAWMRGGVGA